MGKQSRTTAEEWRLDWVKWIFAIGLVAVSVWGPRYYPVQSVVVNLVAGLVLTGLALWLALQTASGQRLLQFAKDARTEMRKIVWPTKAETMQSTLAVMAMVVVMGLILWAVDALLLRAVAALMGYGG